MSAAACAGLLTLVLAGCTASEPGPAETPATVSTPKASVTAEPAAEAKPSLKGEPVADSFGNVDFYITADGDTLASVAAAYGFSEAKIAEFNGLQQGAPLTPGTRLRLLPAGPGIGAMGAATFNADGIPTSYTIVPDDTLAGISYRFNLTNDQLAEANKVPFVHEQGNVYFVESGRTIALQKNPVDSRSGTGKAVQNSWDRVVSYTTVDGDSFDSLGYKFRVSPAQLLLANPSLAENAPIPAGTQLQLIPCDVKIEGAQGEYTTDSEGIPLTYTTVPGDTEKQVSFRFGVTTLAEANRPTTGLGGVWYEYTIPAKGTLAPGQMISLSLDQPINNPGS